jgi:hypothetical protein
MPEDAVMDVGLGSDSSSPEVSTDTAVDTPSEGVESADLGAELTPVEPNAAETGAESEEPGAPPQEKAIKEALRALKETNPAAAKALNEAFFQRKEFLRDFPEGLASVRQLKTAFDAVGGPDGFAQLQQKSGLLDTIDNDIAEGNPKVLDDIIKDAPDGFKKLVPEIVSRLESLDPKAYGDAMRPHFVRTLEAAGLDDVIEGVGAALQAGDGPAIQTIVANLQKWYAGLKQQVQKTSSVDPERQKFEMERTKFGEERENSYRADIGRQANVFMASEMAKAVAPLLKGKSLSADAKADLNVGIAAEVNKRLTGDTNYQTQVKAFLKQKNRDSGKIVAYINAKLGDTVVKATQAVWSRRYGAVPAKAAAPASTTPGKVTPTAGRIGGNAVPTMLAKAPSTAELDLSRDPRMLMFMTGKGYLKSTGKYVTWKK